MATFPTSTSVQRAEAMRRAWTGMQGGTGSVLAYTVAFLTAYPPLAQGLYYLLCGIWPLLSTTTYRAITGHEGDLWHVEMMSALLLVIGGTLCLAAYRSQGTPEVLFLAFTSALGMMAIDVHLVYRGHSRFYLLDAALEVGLVIFWVYGWRSSRLVANAPRET